MKQQEPGVRTLCSGRAGLGCDVRALSASSLGASEVHPSCKPTLSPLHTVPNPGSALLGYLVLLRAEIGCACTHRAIASMRPRFRPPVFAHLPDFSCWRVSCLRHRVCPPRRLLLFHPACGPVWPPHRPPPSTSDSCIRFSIILQIRSEYKTLGHFIRPVAPRARAVTGCAARSSQIRVVPDSRHGSGRRPGAESFVRSAADRTATNQELFSCILHMYRS